jgi:hypothetical protein
MPPGDKTPVAFPRWARVLFFALVALGFVVIAGGKMWADGDRVTYRYCVMGGVGIHAVAVALFFILLLRVPRVRPVK